MHHFKPLLTGAIAGAWLAVGAAEAQDHALTFASAYAANDHQSLSLEEFARLAGDYTEGRVAIDVAVAGVLGGERDVAEGIQLGTVDGAILGGILQNFDPAMAILEFPFLFDDDDHVRRVMDGEVGEQIAERLVVETGIRPLGYIMRTPRVLTTNSPVTSLDDVQGASIRVPEMRAHLETWNALGANPTPMAFTEVYTALQLGTVDGQENPLGVIYANRFHEVASHLAQTDHLVGFMLITISDEVFGRLSEEDQEALIRAAADASAYNDEILAEQAAEWEEAVAAAMEFTRPDMAEWRAAVAGVPDRFDDVEGFRDLYEAIRDLSDL
ncbi:MAG: TRAP transporter substrate-binding protein [Alkalilacustris sp.]